MPAKRSAEEVEEMMEMIKKIKFFQDRNIQEKDLIELCEVFRFEHVKAHHDVFKYGDPGEKFYIIIKGAVSVQVPNPKIKNWRV